MTINRTESHSERRARLQLLAAELKPKRRAERAEDLAEYERRVERARATGAHLVTGRRHSGYVDLDDVVIHSGYVDLVNLNVDGELPRSYDYRVEVGIDDERQRLRVDEVRVIRRAAGPDITARCLQRDRVGEVEAVAIAYLTRDRVGGRVSISRESAKGLMVRRGRPESVTDERLAEVARIHREATESGETPGKAVARVMRLNYSTARNWITKAKARGLIESPA